MPDLVIGDYLEVKSYCYMDNQLGINVLHAFVVSLSTPVEDFEDAAGDFGVYIGGSIKPLLTNDAKYLGVSLRVWRPTGPNWATVWSKAGNGFGTSGTAPVPKQVAGMISKRTPIGGPAGRGRAYVPFPDASDVEPDGNPTNAYLADLQTLGDDWAGIKTIDAGFSVQWGLMRWRQPLTFIAVTTCLAKDRFATQRRRGDYGRVNAIPAELA